MISSRSDRSVARLARSARMATLLSLAAATLGLPPAGAQEPHLVSPGEVAAVPVRVPLPAEAAGPGRYTIEPHPDINLFTPASGRLAAEGDSALLPVAFALSRDRAAGPFEAARVRLEWPGGSRVERAVLIRVASVWGLLTSLSADPVTVSPGDAAELRYGVSNRGNATDTVHLRLETGWGRPVTLGSASGLVVGAGETARGTTTLRIPAAAAVGSSRRVDLVAEGRESSARAHATLTVVERTAWLEGWEHVPATAFLGSSSAGGRSVVAALHGRGEIGDGTDLSLDARFAPGGSAPSPIFHEQLPGPALRVGIRRPSWSLALGQVEASGEPVGASHQSGDGVDLGWSDERLSARVFAARPSTGGSTSRVEGHLLVAAGGLATDAGRVRLAVSDLERRPAADASASRFQSAGIGFRLDRDAPSRLLAEAGIARVVDPLTGREAVGPVFEARYRRVGESLDVEAFASRVPARAPGLGTRGDQLYVGGRQELAGGAFLRGRAHWSESPRAGEAPEPRTFGISAGGGYAGSALRLQALLRHEKSLEIRSIGGAYSATTAALSGHLPLGATALEGRLELGRGRGAGSSAPVHDHHLGLRWNPGAGWLWVGAGYRDDLLFESRLGLDLQGSVELRGWELEGGLEAWRDPDLGRGDVRGWGRVGVDVSPGLVLVAGLERRPRARGSTETTVSLGLEKQIDLPVPVPARPGASGVVFEDRDNDGERDPGEPGIAGVGVRVGPFQAVTDPDGRFVVEQRSARGRPVRLETGTLPGGHVVAPRRPLRPAGEMLIPVVRPGSLTLRLFLDDDGDGLRGDDELAPERGTVILRDAEGRRRSAVVREEGEAEFGSLTPGAYALEIRVPESRRRGSIEAELSVQVTPGAEIVRDVALPLEAREIRF